MKFFSRSRLVADVALGLCLTAMPLAASEVATLRNGFEIVHRTHEQHDGQVRLYLDASHDNFVDVPETEIVSYDWRPDASSNVGATASPLSSADTTKTTGAIVGEASQRHGVDADFIRSVIRQESGGNEHAVSRTGARGLMQLMPQTAAGLGVNDSFDRQQNVEGGTLYLRQLLEHYNGDAVKALAAYNAGPAAVDRFGGVPPYRETQNYVRRVVADYNRAKAAKILHKKTHSETQRTLARR